MGKRKNERDRKLIKFRNKKGRNREKPMQKE